MIFVKFISNFYSVLSTKTFICCISNNTCSEYSEQLWHFVNKIISLTLFKLNYSNNSVLYTYLCLRRHWLQYVICFNSAALLQLIQRTLLQFVSSCEICLHWHLLPSHLFSNEFAIEENTKIYLSRPLS